MQPVENPNHDRPPPADQAARRVFAAHPTMTFKNEVVSDADIDRYELPFKKGDHRWWTRDAERDYYLWGGLNGNLAFESEQEGWFYLYVDRVIYGVKMIPGLFSESLQTDPYIITWKAVALIVPNPNSTWRKKRLTGILKEALSMYGLFGENDKKPFNWQVNFDF